MILKEGGGRVIDQVGEKKFLLVWVKWGKEMKGGRREGKMAACADTLDLLQDLSSAVREFLSSAQTAEQH